MAVTNIKQHLIDRSVLIDQMNVSMDEERCAATFFLWNLSGQLIGYQQYCPNGTKEHRQHLYHQGKIDKFSMAYFTYVTKTEKTSSIAVWGLETVKLEDKFLFLTEGIFDAVKLQRLGYPAIAVLTNNPKPIKNWLFILNKKVIGILDDDKAGRKLKSVCDIDFSVPKPYNDLGEMPLEEVSNFIERIIK